MITTYCIPDHLDGVKGGQTFVIFPWAKFMIKIAPLHHFQYYFAQLLTIIFDDFCLVPTH